MSKRTQQSKDRAARVASMRAAQRRRERRRDIVVIGVAVVVSLALVAAVVTVIVRERGRQAALEAAANAPIAGVQEYPDLPREHVTEPVTYEQTPPVGGQHAPVWTNCGVYTASVMNEQSVHSLEHGAVWITYRPDLPAQQVEALTSLAEANSYTLLSPFEDLASPVVASAWGVQLAVEDAADARLERFLEKYQQGEQTPEPGAACTGGAGGM